MINEPVHYVVDQVGPAVSVVQHHEDIVKISRTKLM